MDSPNNAPAPRARLHPLVATAAVAVIVLSAVGVTALVMNHSSATPSPYDAPPPAVASATNAAPTPPPEAQPVLTAPRVASATSAYNAPTTPDYGPPPAPSNQSYEAPPSVAQAPPVCRNCGVVDSVREIEVKGKGTGVGAVGGAVVGGLLGNMVGSGRGKALATVAGAVGGGFGGNAIEKNVRSEVEHQMVVRLDNGTRRTFTQVSPFPYREGERVRIVDGRVEHV